MQVWKDLFAHMPTITTERLILQPASMRDADDLYECCRDPQVARYVLWEAHSSVHVTRNYLRFLIRQYRQGEPGTFVIHEKESGKAIGTIGFMWLEESSRSCELGYSLGRAWWNRGYMTEALRAVVQMCFDKMNLNRVEAQHDVLNPASGCVMRHAGMQYEGTLRQRIYNKGRLCDVALYAILREDYQVLRRKEAKA